MHAELDERAGIDQQVEPLAGGQLVGGVLGGDLLRAPAEHDLLPAGPQVLGQGAQQAGGLGVGGHSEE